VSPHEWALERSGAAPAARQALAIYLDLLAAWSRRVNLTGAGTPERRVRVLVEPALVLVPLLLPGALLDVGAGNGSPGFVLALLDPGRSVTLLEPRARRWAFLREAVRACGAMGVEVRRERHEEYRGRPAANVTARGVTIGEPALARLVAPGGQALLSSALPGSRPAPVPAGALPVFIYRRDVPRGT
jgi:16S rRNA (guanine527-N7)-methyltransferase